MNKIQNGLDWMKDFLAGGISGALAKTIIAPLQRAKLLLLMSQNYPNYYNQPYNGILDCLKRVYKDEGLLAFWKGNQVYISRQFPLQAINFSLKDLLNRQLFNERDANVSKYSFSGSFLSGGIAGSIGLLIMYPDFSRINMVVNITENNGLKGIYKGFPLACLGVFIYRSLYFGLYDSGKEVILLNKHSHLDDNFFNRLLLAQVSVSISETVSYPINTIRKMLMLQRNYQKPLYTGALDCCSKIIQHQGILSLFKGNLSTLSTSIGSSLVLVFYDEFKNLFNRK